ncbi:MAG: hypothetical protein HAW63_00750 [Bdellovibrionaceae bacterium]|nr:hypothetical protein [Pseudobdellovibrionaceae bacterium]
MERDISRIFNYADIPEAVNQLSQLNHWKKQVLRNKQLKPSEQLTIIKPKVTPLRFLYKFQGKEEQVNFISANQARLFSNQNLTRLQEISYYTASCKSSKQGLCLWRRNSSVIDGNVEKGGQSFSLLSNITSLKFRYIGGKQKNPEWKTEWPFFSEVSTNTPLPYAIEITLKVKVKETVKQFQKIALIHHPDIFVPKMKISTFTAPSTLTLPVSKP